MKILIRTFFLSFLLVTPFINIFAQTASKNIEAEMAADLAKPAIFVDEQTPDVYVTKLNIDKDNFSTGEQIKGNFIVSNKSEYPATGLYYSIALIEYKDAERENPIGQYGEISSPSKIYLADWQDKNIDFTFDVPKVLGNGYFSIAINTFYDSGFPAGAWESPIAIEGGISLPRIEKLLVKVGDKTFASQEGPTIQKNEIGEVEITFSNIDKQTEVIPSFLISNFSSVGQEKIKKELPKITLSPNSLVHLIKLPTDGLKPGVYSVELDFLKDGISYLPKTFVRYIVGGDIVNFQYVDLDHEVISKNDKINISVKLQPQPIDIVKGEIPKVGNGEVKFAIRDNPTGEIISSGSKEINLDFETDFSIETVAQKSSSNFSIELLAIKDGEVLDSYTTNLSSGEIIHTEKDPIFSENNIILMIGGILILVCLALVFFLRKRLNKKIISALVFLILIAAVLGYVLLEKVDFVKAAGYLTGTQISTFLNGTDPVKNIASGSLSANRGATLTIKTPASPDDVINGGANFNMKASMSWYSCLNSGGTGWIKANVYDENGNLVGSQVQANINQGNIGGEGQFGTYNVTKNINNLVAPTSGTKFYVELYGYIQDPYGYYGGWQRKAVRFKLATTPADLCANIPGSQSPVPSGTYQSGTDCLCSNGANNPPTCNTCTSPLVWNGTSCASHTCTNGATNYPACDNNVCSNGANNPPTCNTCTSPLVWNGTSCASPTCTNGATNYPACDNNNSCSSANGFETCSVNNVCASVGLCNYFTYTNSINTEINTRMTPSIVNSGDKCTINWSLDYGSNPLYCGVFYDNNVRVTDLQSGVSGFQVNPGQYKVRCYSDSSLSVFVTESQLKSCVLNPTIYER